MRGLSMSIWPWPDIGSNLTIGAGISAACMTPFVFGWFAAHTWREQGGAPMHGFVKAFAAIPRLTFRAALPGMF